MAISSARNMFCRPGSRSASLIFFSWLYIPYPASSLRQLSPIFLGGLKDPSV